MMRFQVQLDDYSENLRPVFSGANRQKDRFLREFLFSMTPEDALGKPDEDSFREERQVLVSVTWHWLCKHKRAHDESAILRIMYWNALEALKHDESSVSLNSVNPGPELDTSKIAFSPGDPILIKLPGRKMGSRVGDQGGL